MATKSWEELFWNTFDSSTENHERWSDEFGRLLAGFIAYVQEHNPGMSWSDALHVVRERSNAASP